MVALRLIDRGVGRSGDHHIGPRSQQRGTHGLGPVKIEVGAAQGRQLPAQGQWGLGQGGGDLPLRTRHQQSHQDASQPSGNGVGAFRRRGAIASFGERVKASRANGQAIARSGSSKATAPSWGAL